jgi:hypothetical protein
VFEKPTVSILKREMKRRGGRSGIWRKEKRVHERIYDTSFQILHSMMVRPA